ncbi:hypothetical protein O3M35_012211 [Rhynocoris fuscipes]|uniref:Nucleolar protein 14 homolog n=1 Tax=Rhynocoris fuscipes TaxID=488301 RepID=A0AAW1CSR6_9HEMI
MAKIKAKKKSISDIKNDKTKKQKDTLSPFEVHVNKQKFHVLGRKLKQDRGLPGLARAKSIKKRKETLLQEYKLKDKANKFIDRRIGERNSAMTKEDKILARFTAERLKAHKRKAMFNLGEDEVLTHKGRSLAEIETFEDPSSDEDDPEHSKGKLDANFVEEAHFGGGLLKKADESKGRAAIIDQLIAESKKRKAEKQEAKEKTLEKTEQLDSEWRELMPMVAGKGGGPSAEPVEKKDPYDLIMSQLKFEARGVPSDRLKSESELAAEEARKLRELEEERLRRMKGEDLEVPEAKKRKQHRSADDLDDGFDIDDDKEFQLIYDKEGKLISQIEETEDDNEIQTKSKNNSDEEKSEEEEDDADSNDENEEDEEADDDENDEKDMNENEDSSESDGEGVFDLSDMKKVDKDDISEEEVETEEQLERDEKVKKSKKSLKNISESSKSEETNKINSKDEINKKKVAFDPIVKTFDETKIVKHKTKEELQKDEEEKKRLMEQAKQELPYTFKIPETYDEFFELMEDKSLLEQKIIIERMIKCNHPSLNEKFKLELNKLFAFLLQFLNDADYTECWSLLDSICPFLFELTKFSPSNAAYSISEVLKEKHDEYLEKKHRYPSTETLIFLKLIPLLFPTSDKRHPVTTPAFVFITEMLHQCQVTTRRAITTGLFLVTLYTQYVTLSKRILPEALNFLCGIIHMATPIRAAGTIVPPFRREQKFLYLQSPCTDLNDQDLIMMSKDLAPKSLKIDDSFRVRSIYLAINLISIIIDLWKDNPGCSLIFEPLLDHINSLEVNKYPESISKTVENIKTSLNEIKNKGLPQIIKEARKPKALRLYDPNIRPVYDKRLRMRETDKKSEHKKLVTKYKKEMKGALREIRRDRSFLANVKFKEIAKSDSERIKKVKEIFSWGNQQQAELNKLARQKKRK